MPDKHINELPTKTQEELNNNLTLWIVGDPDTGTLYQVTIQQLKALVQENWKTVTAASCGLPVAPSSTVYTQISGNASNFGAEVNRTFVIPEDCTAHNLFVPTSTAQPGDGAFVITIRKNGVPTLLKITIAASEASGVKSNTSVNVDFVAGDTYSIELANASASNSATPVSFGLSFTKTS